VNTTINREIILLASCTKCR